MSTSKFIGIALTTFVCATALVVDAGAQGRGGGGGGRGGSGGGSAGRAPSGGGSRGPSRPSGGPSHAGPPRGGAPGNGHAYPNRSYGRAPYYGNAYRGYYGNAYRGYYGGYRGYYGYPRFSFGIGLGYPYYGYYGYGYPYYGYAYPYDYGYPAYGYGGAYVVPRGDAYGGIRIQGAPRNAEVYVDGAYAGIVDDYDGVFQRLDLEPGSHEVEIRSGGRPMVYDVNVSPGQTLTIHANIR